MDERKNGWMKRRITICLKGAKRADECGRFRKEHCGGGGGR